MSFALAYMNVCYVLTHCHCACPFAAYQQLLKSTSAREQRTRIHECMLCANSLPLELLLHLALASELRTRIHECMLCANSSPRSSAFRTLAAARIRRVASASAQLLVNSARVPLFLVPRRCYQTLAASSPPRMRIAFCIPLR